MSLTSPVRVSRRMRLIVSSDGGDERARLAVFDGRELPGVGIVEGEVPVGGERLGRHEGRETRRERQAESGRSKAEEPPPARGSGAEEGAQFLFHPSF